MRPFKWLMVHHHESGVDTVQFEGPAGLARELAVSEDETTAMIGLCNLVGVDYEPDRGETADLVLMPPRESNVTITQLELDGLAANAGIN